MMLSEEEFTDLIVLIEKAQLGDEHPLAGTRRRLLRKRRMLRQRKNKAQRQKDQAPEPTLGRYGRIQQ